MWSISMSAWALMWSVRGKGERRRRGWFSMPSVTQLWGGSQVFRWSSSRLFSSLCGLLSLAVTGWLFQWEKIFKSCMGSLGCGSHIETRHWHWIAELRRLYHCDVFREETRSMWTLGIMWDQSDQLRQTCWEMISQWSDAVVRTHGIEFSPSD